MIADKNTIFSEILDHLPYETQISTSKAPLTCQLLGQEEEKYFFEFAVERQLLHERRDFCKEILTNWPSFKVFIWNDKNYQYAVIQRKVKAFPHTQTVISALNKYINLQLKRYNLCVYFEPLFEKQHFWDTIRKHPDNLKEVRFELITPNMSNISKCLSEVLKELAKATISCKMTVSLISDSNSALKIDDSNQTINDMLSYASNGGGNVAFKAKGLRKLIKTNNSIKYFEMDDVEISSLTIDKFIQMIENRLK